MRWNPNQNRYERQWTLLAMQEELTRWLILHGTGEVPAKYLIESICVDGHDSKWVKEAAYFRYLKLTHQKRAGEYQDKDVQLCLSKKGHNLINFNGVQENDGHISKG